MSTNRDEMRNGDRKGNTRENRERRSKNIDPELRRKMMTSHMRKCHAANNEIMSAVEYIERKAGDEE